MGKKAAALRYQPGDEAPILLAFGENRAAERILELARQAGIPVRESPAEALEILRGWPVGEEIPEELYALVAQILATLRERIPAPESDRG